MSRLAGRVAIVTGGGGGIGEHAALGLAAEGASVVVNDCRSDAADAVVAEVRAAGGDAVASYASVTTMDGGMHITTCALTNFGPVDILVNCAGNFTYCLLEEMSEEVWDSQIDVHLKGHFNCIRAAVPEMIKQGAGRIINFSSRAAFGDPRGGLPYAAAKAGILGATVQQAGELKDYGITVNAILPSADTTLFPKEGIQTGTDVPPTTTVDPSFVAPLVVYLASDDAAQVSGRFFYACGGDIGLYYPPLRVRNSASTLGEWSIDDLERVLPSLLVVRD
ncbi:MAG: SDR family NAD(P)-dependent oxidoreductase [Chloroflexi bacterium]|nr:SDR family NAD(P)-dependent oxidoreductase [Chloroflexota bacterium]